MHATPGAIWLDASIIGHLADIGDANRKIGSPSNLTTPTPTHRTCRCAQEISLIMASHPDGIGGINIHIIIY